MGEQPKADVGPYADAQYVSVEQEDFRLLVMKATLGRVLGRNIERAAAGWALMFSLLLVIYQPADPFYNPITRTMPLDLWAWIVGVMSASRVLVLIVNGWWPITLKVRVYYSIATLALVWSVLVALSWITIGVRQQVFPGVALAPFAVTVELLCYLALRTRIEAEKGPVNVGHGASGDRQRGFGLIAGVRERMGEAPK